MSRRTTITRTERFSAGHRLYRADWSDQKNAEVFGKCSNPAGHGHNYTLEVTLTGEVDPETGFILDLKHLRDIIRDRIIEKVDHKNLNTDVDFLRGVNPTAENLAAAFWRELADAFPAGMLDRIVLHETENNRIEYKGE